MFVVAYPTALEMWRVEEGRNVVEHKFDYPLPDPEVLNDAIPLSEWKKGLNGQPEQPWKLIFIVVMINTTTGAVYAYKNSTYGARLMHEQLVERIAVKQMLCGEHVLPIAQLEKRPWHSAAFGPQLRPHLEPIDWRKIGGGDEPPTPLLPAPTPTTAPASAAPADASAAAPTAASTASPSTVPDSTKPVKPMTVGEFIADELPPWA
jgi:hypothetical protein